MLRYIVKAYRESGNKRSPYVVAEELTVHHPPILRAKGKPIGGLFQEVEGTGRFNRKRFRVAVSKGTTARGIEVSRGRELNDADATAAGVKKVVRVLRDQEAEKLDAIDTRIEDLERQVDEARAERVEIVREAWAKGNVVRLAEMEQRAEDYQAGLKGGGS